MEESRDSKGGTILFKTHIRNGWKFYHYSGACTDDYEDVLSTASDLFHKDFKGYHVFKTVHVNQDNVKSFDYYLYEDSSPYDMPIIKRSQGYYKDSAPTPKEIKKLSDKYRKWIIPCFAVLALGSIGFMLQVLNSSGSPSGIIPPAIISLLIPILGPSFSPQSYGYYRTFHEVITNDGMVTDMHSMKGVLPFFIQSIKYRLKLRRFMKEHPDATCKKEGRLRIIRSNAIQDKDLPYSSGEYIRALEADEGDCVLEPLSETEVIDTPLMSQRSVNHADRNEVIVDLINRSESSLPYDSPVLKTIKSLVANGSLDDGTLAELEAAFADMTAKASNADSVPSPERLGQES